MNTTFVITALALCIGLATLLLAGAERLLASTPGKLVLLAGIGVLPLSVSVGGLTTGLVKSSQAEFCLSCHEMTPYGQSLFVDGDSLAAVHFQNRLVDRDYACYVCHKDYAMFGDVRTKLHGLNHLLVHYFGEAPDPIELYAPYPNANCLHCHNDSRRYLEAGVHGRFAAEIASDERSCLDCHRSSHDLDGVHSGRFWQAVAR